MKRLFCGIVLLILAGFGLVAQAFRMDVNYYYISREVLELTDTADATADIERSSVPAGLALNFDIPFTASNSMFVAGMNIETGFDFGGKYEMANWGEQEDMFSGSYFISMGALFGMNLGSFSSLSFRPGLQFTMDYGIGTWYFQGNETSVDLSVLAFAGALSLNAGYTFWFSSSSSGQLGLNVGVDYDIPLFGTYIISDVTNVEDYVFDITGKSSLRFFVGLSFSFGSNTTTSSTRTSSSSSHKTTQAKRQRSTTGTQASNTTSTASESTTTAAENDRVATGSINTTQLTKAQRERLYNLKIGDQIVGPYSIATISLMAKTGVITWNMPVRSTTTRGWTKMGALAEFAPLFK